MRAAAGLAPLPRLWPARRWPALAAAALLIVAGVWGWSGRGLPAYDSASGSRGASAALASPEAGVEVLLAHDSRLTKGDGDLWTLSPPGACLVSSDPSEEGGFRLLAGPGLLWIRGEAMVRLSKMSSPDASCLLSEANAAATEALRLEVAVLSGSARIEGGGESLDLAGGQASRLEPGRTPTLLPLSVEALTCLKDRVFGAGEDALAGSPVLLDGRSGKAVCMSPSTPLCYEAVARVRALDPGLTLGFHFLVGGKPGVWITASTDGAWHRLRISVSDGWVRLEEDGRSILRIPRSDFRANPVDEISGLGIAAWGGRVEVSSLQVVPWASEGSLR